MKLFISVILISFFLILKAKFMEIEENESILILKLNNCKELFTLSYEFIEELESILNKIDLKKINTLILTNIIEEKPLRPEEEINIIISSSKDIKEELINKQINILEKIESFPIPIIAALDGYVFGGLFDISINCDIRICTNNTIFGHMEHGKQKLTKIINVGMAKQIILSDQTITSKEALKIGLINSIFPKIDLIKEAKKLAKEISNNSLNAIKNSKKVINAGIEVNLDKGLEFEEKIFGNCFETSEQKERMENFLNNKNNKKELIKKNSNNNNLIIKCPNKLPDKKTKWYIFLAGPILGAPEWQNNVPHINVDEEIILLSPRRENYDNFNYDEQVNWETICLRTADIILFWIPEEKEKIKGHEYAQTTRTEYGEYLARGKKIIVGTNKNFIGRRYFETKAKQYGINKIYDNINDCIHEIEEYIKQFKNKATFYTSDTHFDSERALSLSKRPFKSIEEMNWKIIENWNNRVHPKDIVYHLGDFGELWPIKYLNGEIVLIEGNYEKDEINKNKEYKNKLENIFIKVYDKPYINDDFVFSKKILCHEPIDGLELYNKIKYDNTVEYNKNIFILFGHIHGRQKIKEFGIDVGVDANNFYPISEEEVQFFKNAISQEKYDSQVWCNKNTKNIYKKHKVFLGGTCENTTWREDLIKLLKIDYFNPVVKNWNETYQIEEERQKDIECDLQLYVITPEMKGFYTFSEVVEAAINIGERCIFCVLDSENRFDNKKKKSLDAIIKLIKKYNAKYYNNLNDVAEYLNSFV